MESPLYLYILFLVLMPIIHFPWKAHCKIFARISKYFNFTILMMSLTCVPFYFLWTHTNHRIPYLEVKKSFFFEYVSWGLKIKKEKIITACPFEFKREREILSHACVTLGYFIFFANIYYVQ